MLATIIPCGTFETIFNVFNMFKITLICPVSGRIYKCLFTGSVSSLLTLPLDMLSTWVMIPVFSCTTHNHAKMIPTFHCFCIFTYAYMFVPPQREPACRLSTGLFCCHLHTVCIYQPSVAQRTDSPWWRSPVVGAAPAATSECCWASQRGTSIER